MTNADAPPPRRRGRPPTGKNPLLQVRVDPQLQAAFKKTAGPGWPKTLRTLLEEHSQIGDDLWRRAEAAAQELGIDRATLVRDFLRWLLHEPGAKLPRRPAVKPDKTE